MKVGFTGTRHGMTVAQFSALRSILLGSGGEFHHGDCVGADEEAARLARSLGFHIIGHPPVDEKNRAYFQSDEERTPLPFLARNKQIVIETETLIAAPFEATEIQRSGTWSTLRFAKRTEGNYWLLRPDGITERSTPYPISP